MSADKKFEKYAEDVFQNFIKSSPLEATVTYGIHDYDHKWDDISKKAIAKKSLTWEKESKKFKSFNPRNLKPQNRVDRQIALQHYGIKKLIYDSFKVWARDPYRPVGVVGSVFFLMMVRNYAPFPERLEKITERLETIDVFLKQAKGLIGSDIAPDKLWTDLAIDSAKGLPSFLDVIDNTSKQNPKVSSKLKNKVSIAIKKAKKAIAVHLDWLENDVKPIVKPNQWRLGKTKFEKILKIRKLGFTSDEIKDLGMKLLDQGKSALQRLCNQLRPGVAYKEVVEELKNKHPKDFHETLTLYRDSMAEARKFVIDNDVITLPEGENMEVIETPPFMRALVPSAAMFSPAMFDREQKSIYLVTPPPPGKPEYLKEHSYHDIPNTCVHEAYPGHHIHLANVNKHPSRVRALALANGWLGIEIVEGWAHYTEEFMINSGFHDTIEARILQIIGDIWRCCRMVIDVNIHTGVWSIEEAVDFLVEQAWMVRDAAFRELNWYTRRPSYPLSYRLGKYLIFDLKKRVKKQYGNKFSDKYFHDTIVQSGVIPFSITDEIFTYNPPL